MTNSKIFPFFKAGIYIALPSLLVLPLVGHAGVLNIFFNTTKAANVVVSENAVAQENSQTMPLLQAAVHIDPNPAKGGGDITVVDDMALMAESGVTGTIVEVNERDHMGKISLYEVRDGDSLSQIARMFGVSVNTIKWANDIDGGISPGDRLVILPISGIQYTVKKNDSIEKIAKKYDADAKEIAQFNGLTIDAQLTVGDTVIIPNAEPEKAAEPVKKKTTTTSTKKTTVAVSTSGYYTNPAPGSSLTQGIHGYNGVDLGARIGTSVVAAAGGTVITSKSSGWNGGYGSYIVVSHANGTQTLYAHLSRVDVVVGTKVGKGEVIGAVGNTGKSTGPHLHFEVRGAKNPFGK